MAPNKPPVCVISKTPGGEIMTEPLQIRTPQPITATPRVPVADLATLARVRDRLAAIDRDEPFRGLSILDLEARWIRAGWELSR
jgi:hypothetical protein